MANVYMMLVFIYSPISTLKTIGDQPIKFAAPRCHSSHFASFIFYPKPQQAAPTIVFALTSRIDRGRIHLDSEQPRGSNTLERTRPIAVEVNEETRRWSKRGSLGRRGRCRGGRRFWLCHIGRRWGCGLLAGGSFVGHLNGIL